MDPRKKKKQIICKCNEISKEEIADAVKNGAKTLNEIFDRTMAGVGPCGGSCRGKIRHILECYLETGEIPDPVLDVYRKIKNDDSV